MSDITLSLSTRSNLIALQSTQSLLTRTSNRISTGLRVTKPLDDASAYFAAAALNRRADSFSTAQRDIQQASSTLDVAINALQSIYKYVQNLQGTLTSLGNAQNATESANLTANYNNILSQIDNLANGASFLGVNLINSSSTTLGVSFAGQPGANDITLNSIRSDAAGLGLSTQASNAFFQLTSTIPSQSLRVSVQSIPSFQSVPSRAAFAASVTVAAVAATPVVNSVGSIPSVQSMAAVGTGMSVPSRPSVQSIESVPSTQSVPSFAAVNISPSVPQIASRQSVDSIPAIPSMASVAGSVIAAANTNLITALNSLVGTALSSLASAQSTLGSTNAILGVRLEFSKSYVSSLSMGAANLTVADLNQESANLTSLQTTQSLGIASLAITNQAQQSLLRLF